MAVARPSGSREIASLAADLLSHGLSHSKGAFLSGRQIPEMVAYAKECLARWEVKRAALGIGEWRLTDEISGCEYWYPTRTSDPDSTNPEVFGRRRIFFPDRGGTTGIDCVDAFYCDPMLLEVGEARYGGPCSKLGVLLELLTPSIEGDSWHIDAIEDQYKAMILLSDTKMSNGPLRYKIGSHLSSEPGYLRLLHSIFKYGLDYAYPSKGVVDKLSGEVRYGTGEAGDCIFFDTSGIHSGTRCLDGQRLALVVYLKVNSQKNATLSAL
jgi:hypothetical protein